MILQGRIHCLYNKVIDHVFVATSQPINDLREQMFRIDTSQLALIRVSIVQKAYNLHHITWRFEGNNVRIVEFNISP